MGLRLAVVGSRVFNNTKLMESWIWDLCHGDSGNLTIVSGGAIGADALAKNIATKIKADYVGFPADWDKHGRAAGYIRNKKIVDNSDMTLAFWDGKSKGTKHTIDLTMKAKKTILIVYF